MASFVARGRAHRPSTICEVCSKHFVAPRNPTASSLRLFSVVTRPPVTRRTYGNETAALSTTRARLREYSSAAAPTESPVAVENNTGGAFIARGPIAAIDLPPEARCARLDNRRLIAICGPDAAKFLQGLITNNVDSQSRAPFYAAFLDARGRMLHDVFVWTHPDLHLQKDMIGTKGEGEWACYIEVQESEMGALAKHLKRHKLRSKVDIRVVEDDESTGKTTQVWALWGGNQTLEAIRDQYEVLTMMKDPRFILDNVPKNPSGHPTIERALLVPKQQSAQFSGHYEEYTRLRYSYGVIEGDEIPKETHPTNKGSSLPMECNVDISQGIDFKKGCYVGQELTIRTKHTGVVRKRVLPVALSKADARQEEMESQQVPELVEGFDLDPIQFESADIKQLDESGQIKKGRATGKIISVAGNLGLALCRLEMMTPMKVSAEGGSWKPGMEFAIASAKGDIIKVKPFLRDEWVARVRDLWDRKRERI